MRTRLLLPLLFCAAATAADIPPPDSKSVAHEARIEGPKGFAAHEFFLYPVGHIPGLRSGEAVRVTEGQEVPFFKHMRPRLYAYAGSLPRAEQIDEQWIASHKLAVSDVQLERLDYLPTSDPRARIQTTWRVTGVTADKVTVVRDEQAFDREGKLLKGSVAAVDTPAGSPATAAMSLPSGLLAVLAVLAGCVGVWLVSRRVR